MDRVRLSCCIGFIFGAVCYILHHLLDQHIGVTWIKIVAAQPVLYPLLVALKHHFVLEEYLDRTLVHQVPKYFRKGIWPTLVTVVFVPPLAILLSCLPNRELRRFASIGIPPASCFPYSWILLTPCFASN